MKTKLALAACGLCALWFTAPAAESDVLPPPPSTARDGGNQVPEPDDETRLPPPPPPEFAHDADGQLGEGPGARNKRGRMPGPNGMRHWMMLKVAFDRLDDDTRNELLILMKENPEAFRERMDIEVEKFRAERAKEIEKQVSLLTGYLENKDEESKNAFRAMVRTEFMRQLEDNRRMVEELEKRVERLTAEYKERAENADKIVEGQTQFLMKMSPEELREFLTNPPPPPGEKEKGNGKFPGPGKNPPR